MSSSPPPSMADMDPSSHRDKRVRLINVYDAVAGRATIYDDPLYLPADPERSTRRRASVPADAILAPEEVLFRRVNAPVRYAEDDMYWTNEDLPDGGQHVLPSSDLLKSIHHYVSRYYAALNVRLGGEPDAVDERSMDETALLAFGILLEEAARDALGKEGDLVFTEGEGEGQRKRSRVARSLVKGKEAVGEDTEAAETDYSGRETSRAPKRSKRVKAGDV